MTYLSLREEESHQLGGGPDILQLRKKLKLETRFCDDGAD